MNTAARWAITALLVLHGLIHLMGFLNEWHLADIKELSDQTLVPLSEPMSRILGLAWLFVCLVFLSAAAVLVLKSMAWQILALVGVALSQLLIVLWWKDARFGTVANLLLASIVLLQVLSRPGSYPTR